MLKYVVCLCRGCGGCCVFCLYCEAWSCRCSCMTCSLLMLVEDAVGDHTEEAYSRAGLITAL